MSTAPGVAPKISAAHLAAIPDDLKELDQWCLWRYATRDGRQTKLPYQVNGLLAESNNPLTWSSFDEVWTAFSRGNFTGIGFVFSPDDPFTGIDLDDCMVNGELKPWAQRFVARFCETYMEVSPSGNGVKIFCKGRLPDIGGKRSHKDGAIEIYDRGRFFTVTGRAWRGAPPAIEEHQTDVEHVYAWAKRSTKQRRRYDLKDFPKVYAKQKEGDPARHEFLKTQAARLRNLGMEFPELLTALKAINLEHCVPPKSDKDVEDLALYFAGRESWAVQSPAQVIEMKRPAPLAVSETDLTRELFNDHGNAQRLIKYYGHDLRYCHAFKKWLVWDGRRWCADQTDQVRRYAKATMLEFLKQAIASGKPETEKFAKASLDSKRISNALREAECELPVTTDQLDTHPYLLNFKNGVVDLRTGELMPHTRDLYITKLVHFDYEPRASCQTFVQFLYRIMGAGPDASEGDIQRANRLVGYLQKALGYSLTGSTGEKVVFLAHGSGNNGKTTLLSLFRQLLDEYSVLLQIDTLMVRQESNNTQADLADLRGARFVMTSETEEGQRLAEGKLKRITQGMGRIKACRKYENPIEFLETHKLWMDANHKPIVRGTDNAIWNRLHPIPFSVTIAKEDQDRELPSKLMKEGPGVLAWAVSGARSWFANGLGKSPEVEAAVQEYRGEMDQVGRFIAEACVMLPNVQVQARKLYVSYKHWAEEGSESVMMETAFGRKVTDKPGITKERKESGISYLGIGLRT